MRAATAYLCLFAQFAGSIQSPALADDVTIAEDITIAAEPAATFRLSDQAEWLDDSAHGQPDLFQPASMELLQPPMLPPQAARPSVPLPSVPNRFASLFDSSSPQAMSLLAPERREVADRLSTDFVLSLEAKARLTTDIANLAAKSHALQNMGTQHRSQDVTEMRPRGGREGSQNGSGSYWVPARIDLDTALSKIDSRVVNDLLVIKGPYAADLGPGFSFIDFDLLDAPRYADGFQMQGSSSFDFKSNGSQWHGRQAVWGGAEDWGFRIGYGHRTGNDYNAGNGSDIPGSYNTRMFDVAVGQDLSPDNLVDVHYLRLDQTGVELPGQAFDIDYLVTDGFQVEASMENQCYFDRLETEAWYNRTELAGNAQNASKRRQFPIYNFINFVGNTNVDSLSTGYRLAGVWGEPDDRRLRLGTDLRYIRQELTEITSGRFGFSRWSNANSPIPNSEFVDPGLFVEYLTPITDQVRLTWGARMDLVVTAILEDAANLNSVGSIQRPYAAVVGTNEWDQDVVLWSTYVTGDYRPNDCWRFQAGVGYAERPPTLTELYAAQPFMFLIQSGLNTVTGDPRLNKEKLIQVDLGAECTADRLRVRLTGFAGWLHDYITYENLRVIRAPPAGQVAQAQLKYVNTDKAILTGGELYCDYDWSDWLTPFAAVQYVAGRDLTRNGDFATRPASPALSSERIAGLLRGFFSGIPGATEEPLPGILPLESRLGLRLHEPCELPGWAIELTARSVEGQDRVATSLLETPTPGFVTWDLRGYWRARKRLLVVAGVENFTDRNYREHLDFRPQPGSLDLLTLQPGITYYLGSELVY